MSRGEICPTRPGIGLRTPHLEEILHASPAPGFVELHPENYFWQGGPAHDRLDAIRSRYAMSFHGVGLSMGSTDELSRGHLAELKHLVDRYQPDLVSEHLSWSSVGGRYFNDLLPLPLSGESARHLSGRIVQVQEALDRQILIENISAYVHFEGDRMEEWEFLVEVAVTSGCGILLDVNNVHVNACNLGVDAETYVDSVPAGLIGEIHLAGHSRETFADRDIIVDTHSCAVCEPVWALYSRLIARCGPRPTLIEWDADIPALGRLLAEARKAGRVMEKALAPAA